MTTPEWVHHAVFYQIFPDRFARSERVRHPEGLRFRPWGAPPEEQGFQGGDLYGVAERLDHLEALGVTALYLNPVFASASNHRYHTYDYFAVDPLLGGDAALRYLLDAAHERGLRVVLDGVFNHASRGFWPFHHVLENGGDSPYVDWFHIRDWPLRPYAPDAETPHNYAAWAGLPALPKLNTETPAVRRFLFDVARHWIDFGIDGWRLDVPEEIDDDAFWQQFRREVKQADPDAYICGEIWTPAERWLQGDQFDGVMNYPLLAPLLGFCGARTLRPDAVAEHAHLDVVPLDAPAFGRRLERVLARYPWPATLAQLNLLDSHDMARAAYVVGDDPAALRLAVLLQMTLPGAPCIYYGDEVGLSAPGDPHCREAFPWHEEPAWDHDLLDHYRRATALRHAHRVLRTGRFETLHAEGRVYAFRRHLDGEHAVVAVNAGTAPARPDLALPDDAPDRWRPVWPAAGEPVAAVADRLPVAVPPRAAAVLVSDR